MDCSPFLLQGIFPTQESNLSLLHCRSILYLLSYQESPLPGKELLKLLEFPEWSVVTLVLHLRMGASCQGNQPGKGLVVESIANGQWFPQSHLCSEASIKTQKDRVWRVSMLVNTWRCWNRHMKVCILSPQLELCTPAIWRLLSCIFFFIYLFVSLASLGLCCCTWAFLWLWPVEATVVVGPRCLTALACLAVKQRLSGMQASVAAALGLWNTASVVVVHRLSCLTACGIFPDQESVSPALVGRFLTTGPPGKPLYINLY